MREPRYTNEQVKEALEATRGMITQAAIKLGCNPQTVYNYVNASPELQAALVMEREKMGDIAELALFKKIMTGEHWAISFYLATQHKKRGYVQRQEVSGPDGKPQQIEHVLDLSALDDKDLADLERITRKSAKQ